MNKTHIMSHTKLPTIPVRVFKPKADEDLWEWGLEWKMVPVGQEVWYESKRRKDRFLIKEDLDAETIRSAFFGVRDPLSGLEFLQRTGEWGVSLVRSDNKPRKAILSFEDLLVWQATIKGLSVEPLSSWPSYVERRGLPWFLGYRILEPLEINCPIDGAMRPAEVKCCQTEGCLIALVKLEKLCGLEYRYCARPDCKAGIFKVESQHERIYCSAECAHVVAVRQSRARQASQSRLAKKPKRPKGPQGRGGS